MSASGTKQTSRHKVATSVFDRGCVKTRPSRGRSELFPNCLPSAASTSAISFRNDEIEMEILHASSASEFSHSLDPERTFVG